MKTKNTSPTRGAQLTVKALFPKAQLLAGFVVRGVRLRLRPTKEAPKGQVIELRLEPDPRYRRRCSSCGGKAPGYDREPERRLSHVPLWNWEVQVVYTPRRVDCPTCGVKVEAMPWNEGNHQATKDYMLFLARWGRRLSWAEAGRIFRCSWERVRRSVQWVVGFGLENRRLDDFEAIGIDELHWGKGQKSENYLTVMGVTGG